MIENVKPEVPQAKASLEPVKKGVYQVQILDITDKMRRPYGAAADAPETEATYSFKFGILNTGEYRGRFLWRDVAAKAPVQFKNGKQTATYPIVTAALGVELSEKEGLAFSVESFNGLIGKQLQVMVDVKDKQSGGKKNVITAFTVAASPMKTLTAEELAPKEEIPVISVDEDIKPEDINF